MPLLEAFIDACPQPWPIFCKKKNTNSIFLFSASVQHEFLKLNYRPQYHFYFCFRFVRNFVLRLTRWLVAISVTRSKRNENKCEYGSTLSTHFLLVPIFRSFSFIEKKKYLYFTLAGCLTAFQLTHVPPNLSHSKIVFSFNLLPHLLCRQLRTNRVQSEEKIYIYNKNMDSCIGYEEPFVYTRSYLRICRPARGYAKISARYH